jgi:hypothetical protein
MEINVSTLSELIASLDSLRIIMETHGDMPLDFISFEDGSEGNDINMSVYFPSDDYDDVDDPHNIMRLGIRVNE